MRLKFPYLNFSLKVISTCGVVPVEGKQTANKKWIIEPFFQQCTFHFIFSIRSNHIFLDRHVKSTRCLPWIFLHAHPSQRFCLWVACDITSYDVHPSRLQVRTQFSTVNLFQKALFTFYVYRSLFTKFRPQKLLHSFNLEQTFHVVLAPGPCKRLKRCVEEHQAPGVRDHKLIRCDKFGYFKPVQRTDAGKICVRLFDGKVLKTTNVFRKRDCYGKSFEFLFLFNKYSMLN